MSNNKYFIYSEFFELRKIAEEPEDSEEKDETTEEGEPGDTGSTELTPEEDSSVPSESSEEEAKVSITQQDARELAEADAVDFFEQKLDRVYPDLALFAMNKLWEESYGYFYFFRLKRDGVNLYKDYPNSVKSFIEHKLPVGLYFRFGLDEEFPEYLEVLKKRWKGFPNYPYQLDDFFKKGTYLLNPEETLSNIERIFSEEFIEGKLEWISSILRSVPNSFIVQNIDFFKRALESLFDSSDRRTQEAIAEKYFEEELYKNMPELLSKFASILRAYSYFGNYSVHKIEDKDVVKARIVDFIEKGQSHSIPKEFINLETHELMANRELKRFFEYKENLEEVGPYYAKDEEGYDVQVDFSYALSDISLYRVLNYIKELNGENFSVLDESYIDKLGSNPDFSFESIFEYIVENLGTKLFEQSDYTSHRSFAEFLFSHKYNVLYKDIIEEILSAHISKYLQRDRMGVQNSEEFFKNSFLLHDIKKAIPTDHPEVFKEFFNALLQRAPSLWTKHFSGEYPQFDNLILERLKEDTIEYFSYRRQKNFKRKDSNMILEVIEGNSEFYKKYYDTLKNIVKDLYLKSNKIEIYFRTYKKYFPELNEELIVDKETDENITPTEALIKENPLLYFEKEQLAANEDKNKFVSYPHGESLNLVRDYPQYSKAALYYILEYENPKRVGINRVIHFVLHSKQISEETREEILNSDVFKNLIKLNIKQDTLKEYIDQYPNIFKSEISEFLEDEFQRIFNGDQGKNVARRIQDSKFIKLFFKDDWSSRRYRELFPELSRKTFTAMLNSAKDDFQILAQIPSLNIYSSVFNSFIEDENIYDLLDKAGVDSTSWSYRANNSFKNQLKRETSDKVLAPKIKEAIESDASNFLKTVFKSNEKTNLVFGLLKRDESLTELFYNALLQYDLALTFSLLIAQINGRGELLLNSKSYGREYTVFPEFNNQINKILSIPVDNVNFAEVESKFSSNSMGGVYNLLEKISKDPAFANSDNLIKLKNNLDEYLLDNDPLIIMNNSRDDSSKIERVVRRSVERLELINSSETIDEESRDKKERLIGYAKKILINLYESHSQPKAVFPEKERLTTYLIRLTEDPLIYFLIKKYIIQRNESSGNSPGYHTEIFDLKYFDEIEDFKRDSLNKISNDHKLFDTFVSRKYYEFISEEEYVELIKDFANKNIENFIRVFRDKTAYDNWNYFDIIEENLELRIYLAKLLLDKEKIQEFFHFGFYKKVIENNVLSLDDIVEIIYNDISSDGNPYLKITHRAHHEFFEYLKNKNQDKVDSILKRFYGYRPYDLGFIETYSKKTALNIAKDMVVNARQHLENKENEKIIESFRVENIFNYPETEASLVSLLEDGTAILDSKGLAVGDIIIFSLPKFVAKNFEFYKKHKKSIPNIELKFSFFRDLENREVAIEMLDELQNDNFLESSSIVLPDNERDVSVILDEIQKIKDLKINRSIYQREQRPGEFSSATRYTLSQINTKPNTAMYDINKKLIHAGDGVAHTNVGASGFTSAWGLFSIQTEFLEDNSNRSFFVIEQYQSDYPVVLSNIIRAEEQGNNNLEETYPKHYKDIKAHFNTITAAYPYLILSKAIQTAIIAGFPHIYILKDAARLANIQNPDKAKKLYEDIPREISSGTRVIRENLCWEIEATQENINRLMSKARKVTGKDSKYDFSLSPAQNAQLRMRDRQKRKRSPWSPNAEKLQRLGEITLIIRDKFPGLNVPDFTNPTDAIRFLNEEARPWATNNKGMSKTKVNQKIKSIIPDLVMLKNSWERRVKMMKFAKISSGKNRFRSLELIYLEACFSEFLK